jgi:hypothetical protein
MTLIPKRSLVARYGPLLILALCLPACESGGNFTILGYTTKPNYDCNIHTVYVPIFENRTYYRGLEFDLTQAIVREIEAKTPFKVVSDRDRADTELTGSIVVYTKSILNRNQYNEIREGQNLLTVNIIWRNLHTGEILSKPGKRIGEETPPVLGPPPGMNLPGAPISPPIMPEPTTIAAPNPPAGPGVVPPPLPTGTPNNSVPVLPTPPPSSSPSAMSSVSVPISSLGYFVPELGGSMATAMQQNVNRLAIQVVSMMEKPW